MTEEPNDYMKLGSPSLELSEKGESKKDFPFYRLFSNPIEIASTYFIAIENFPFRHIWQLFLTIYS